MQPDTANMSISMDEAVQTVHKPTRVTCLQCHAKAGGGDAVKRGDLALATGQTTDKHYDVHMATTGANLDCQACHVPENHRFPGKGSDIRPTDLDVDLIARAPGATAQRRTTVRISIAIPQRSRVRPAISRSMARMPVTLTATEATEMHRSWQAGSDHTSSPLHPVNDQEQRSVPVYRHWNRASDNYLLFDVV